MYIECDVTVSVAASVRNSKTRPSLSAVSTLRSTCLSYYSRVIRDLDAFQPKIIYNRDLFGSD